MKRLLLSFLLITGLLVLSPLYAQACQKHEKGEKNKSQISELKEKVQMLWAHQEHLGISDDQMAKVKGLKHEAIKEIIRLKADIDIAALDIKSAMHEKSIDLDKVNKLIDQKYSAKTRIAKAYVKALSDIQSTLTDEQRAKLHDLKKQAMMKKDCPMGKCTKADCPHCKSKKGAMCPFTGKAMEAAK